MLYLHGLGTSGLSCTPFLRERARCVLFVGHLGEEPRQSRGSAGFHVTYRIPAKLGSQRTFDPGFWPLRPERPVWPPLAAKPARYGPSGSNGPACACCPKHQDGTARYGQFPTWYPWSQAHSTFTREGRLSGPTVRLQGAPCGGPVRRRWVTSVLASRAGQNRPFRQNRPIAQSGVTGRALRARPARVREWWGGFGGYPPREGGDGPSGAIAGYWREELAPTGRATATETPGYPGSRGRRRQPGYQAVDDGYWGRKGPSGP